MVLDNRGFLREAKLEINVSSQTTSFQNRAISKAIDVEFDDIKGTIHFVGIGGIGMSALARLALARGKAVSGSDKADSPLLDELRSKGATIYLGHSAENVRDASVLVVSTAITKDNAEAVEAAQRQIPIIHRSAMLAHLTEGKRLIGISGTHGKTTTTGMVAQILIDGKLDPSVVVGGVFQKINANSRHGESDLFVAEVDESDGTQVGAESYISVVTNIEGDHLENYPGGLPEIEQAMKKFVLNTTGATVICADDAGCRSLLDAVNRSLQEGTPNKFSVITYGQGNQFGADYTFESTGPFSIVMKKGGTVLGSVELAVPGEHNKYNALATTIIGLELGIDFDTIAKSLATFNGVNRRFQVLGEARGVIVIDDYAHHPTEVDLTLKGAREYLKLKATQRALAASGNGACEPGRLVVLFQPHQPGRLQNHWEAFCNSFTDADLVLVTDIYVARGKEIEGVNSERFAREINHKNVHYVKGQIANLATSVIPFLQPNDILMTIGAGDITGVGPQIIELLS